MEYSNLTSDDINGGQQLDPALFYMRNYVGLGEMFDIVGVPKAATQSLDAAVEHTQPWIKGDHGLQEFEHNIDPARSAQLHELYAGFGQKDEVMLSPGRYDEILLLGGLQPGNRKRMRMLKRVLDDPEVQTGHVTLLGGQRVVYDKEKPDLEDTLQEVKEQGNLDPWANRILSERGVSGLTETDGIRLAAMEHLGDIALRNTNLRVNELTAGTDAELVQSYEFDVGNTAITLMHSLAVVRKGPSRHTTQSCVEDWIRFREPATNAAVGFISANPHLERTVRSARATIAEAGRPDIRIVGAGSGAIATLNHGFYLGEVARNLWEDQRLVRTS